MRSLALLLFPLAAVAADAPVASGSAGGWTVADAIAVRDANGIRLVFSDRAFDRAGIGGDRRFDIRDRGAHEDDAGGRTLTLRLDADGSLAGLGIGGSSLYSSDMDAGLALRGAPGDTIAGRFDHGDVSLVFDLPLWTDGAIPRGGAPLPADGGEAGEALRRYLAAIAARDFEAFVALSPPAWRESMRASAAKGEAQLEIDAVASELPQGLQVGGGHGEDARAWLDLSGTRGGSKVAAVVTLERDGGAWFVRRIETLP